MPKHRGCWQLSHRFPDDTNVLIFTDPATVCTGGKAVRSPADKGQLCTLTPLWKPRAFYLKVPKPTPHFV